VIKAGGSRSLARDPPVGQRPVRSIPIRPTFIGNGQKTYAVDPGRVHPLWRKAQLYGQEVFQHVTHTAKVPVPPVHVAVA
jgi:hypothetical protein